MKNRLVVIGCLLLLHPSLLTAREFSPVAVPSSFFPLLFLLLSLGVGWLALRLLRSEKERKNALLGVQLAQQALDQAPLDMLWTDSDLTIIQANRTALLAAAEQQLVGRDLLELSPELASHPFVTALQCKTRESASVKGVDSCLPPGQGVPEKVPRTLVAADSRNRAIWCKIPVKDKGLEREEKNQDEGEPDGTGQVMDSASRMKSEFVANINHEIRTPMNAIIGYAEMLINADLGPREKRFVNIIHKSSLTLVSIFNDIMELSKIDSGRMQIMYSSVRLQSIITEVEELFRELAHEKDLHFHCRIAPHLPRVLVLDGLRLKQILQNFVSNAIKFTAKGYVEVIVDGKPSPGKGDCVDLRFRVEDSGIGIPVADQEKIFELFQQREDTISKKYGGVGLGLTLCSRLVAMMGGRIELFSKEGEGARFTVFLNTVKVAERDAVDLLPDIIPAMIDRQQKLLIVDDMDLIKDVFIDFFQDSSFKVLTADNGEEALALALREKPGIIFMDLNLAGTDGRTVTEQLRKQTATAKIPVVVMTGEVLDVADYKPLFDDFLQKPFRLEELKEIIARYVPFEQADTRKATHVDQLIDDEQAFWDGIAGMWTGELERLRSQAVRSGSLADAISLGAAMLKTGESAHQSLLTDLGGELVQYAAEPNILGVDRLLAKLSSIANRK